MQYRAGIDLPIDDGVDEDATDAGGRKLEGVRKVKVIPSGEVVPGAEDLPTLKGMVHSGYLVPEDKWDEWQALDGANRAVKSEEYAKPLPQYLDPEMMIQDQNLKHFELTEDDLPEGAHHFKIEGEKGKEVVTAVFEDGEDQEVMNRADSE